MDIESALKRQYRASLAMLRQAIETCPPDLWEAGTHPRTYWRIAYHAIFYTHLYLEPCLASFQPWEKHRDGVTDLWGEPERLEAYAKDDLLAYVDQVVETLDSKVDQLDLEATETGFHWYPNMGKLEHQLVNLRHVQGHVGQLSELLMAEPGLDIRWKA